jgi:anti-anti-sigma factor
MALEITSETHGETRVLRLSGRLDTETSADFELAAHDLTAAGEKRFVVDLSGISYVSSAGLRVLLSLGKQLSGMGGTLGLCGLSESVRQVFDLSGFSRLFNIAPDLSAALGGAPVSPALGQTAAALLGASEKPATPAAAAPPATTRPAAELLGVAPVAKPGLLARILAWLKGQ